MSRWSTLFRSKLNAANALDFACGSHGESPFLYSDVPLAYLGLAASGVTPLQLRDAAGRLGNVLLSAGLKRFERVAVFKANGPDYFLLAQGIIRAGGIAVPINAGMPLNELRQYLALAGASMLITDPSTYENCIGDSKELPMVKKWLFTTLAARPPAEAIDLSQALPVASTAFEPVSLDSDTDVLIVHTSGTTGTPKGVLATSGSVTSGLRLQHLIVPLASRNRVVTAAPFNHLISHVGLYAALLGNMPVWSISRFEPVATLKLLERERVRVFVAFPDVYLRLYEAGLDKFDLSNMRVWIGAADASHDVHMRAFSQRGSLLRVLGRSLLPALFVDTLGSSEVGSPALTRFVFGFSKARTDRLVGTQNWFGPAARIADESGRTLAPGQSGRLLVRGRTLFKGYWNAHDRLHGVMHDGWWWTGDVGYRDRWGRFYHLDRASDVIHTRQGEVYSLLTEEVLMSHPSVWEAVVVGLRHHERGQVPVALVVPKAGEKLDTEELRGFANHRLRSRCDLQDVIPVRLEDIPRGLTGKVLKRVLRDRYATFYNGGSHRAQAHESGMATEPRAALLASGTLFERN